MEMESCNLIQQNTSDNLEMALNIFMEGKFNLMKFMKENLKMGGGKERDLDIYQVPMRKESSMKILLMERLSMMMRALMKGH